MTRTQSNHQKMNRRLSLVVLGLVLLLAQGSTQFHIKCPEFNQGLYEDVEILRKLEKTFKENKVTAVDKAFPTFLILFLTLSSLLLHLETLICPSCPGNLLKFGFFDSVEYLIKNWFVPQKIDIVDNLRATANYLKREMEKKLKLAYNFDKKQIVHPVMKWGQNYTHVLIYVKYSHRFDTPGCLDVWAKNLTLQKTHFKFKALGIQSDHPLEFRLDFPLFKEIVPDESVDKSESVGTIVIHLKKKKKEIWRYLVPKDFKDSRFNVKVWWELGDIYKRAMNKYNKMIDEDDDNKSSVSWKSKNQKASSNNNEERKRKKKIKKRQQKRWIRWLNSFN